MSKTLKPSPAAFRLIKEFEGCRLRAYPDPGTGRAPWTIGYGHTGPEVRPGMTITTAQAEAYLVADVEKAAKQVRRQTKGHQTSQDQFDALVSFEFNTGALHRSTLLKRHNAGAHGETVREFHRWIYAGGRPLRGLARRRAAEAALYSGAWSA